MAFRVLKCVLDNLHFRATYLLQYSVEEEPNPVLLLLCRRSEVLNLWVTTPKVGNIGFFSREGSREGREGDKRVETTSGCKKVGYLCMCKYIVHAYR